MREAAKKEATAMDEVKEVMLRTAKKLLEDNQMPSTDLQVQIIKTANELVKTVAEM